MLTQSLSQTGLTIFQISGRWLCSRFDPMKEAKIWVEFHKKDFDATQTIVILGLGSGYHVIETLRSYPQKKVVVIEGDAELAHKVLDLHRLDLAAAEVIVPNSVDELLKSSRLQKAVSKIFFLADYKAATALHFDFYESIKNYILARERLGFQFHLRWRTEFSEVLELKKVFMSDRYLLSIQDLVGAVRPDRRDTKTAQLLQCLKEFVR